MTRRQVRRSTCPTAGHSRSVAGGRAAPACAPPAGRAPSRRASTRPAPAPRAGRCGRAIVASPAELVGLDDHQVVAALRQDWRASARWATGVHRYHRAGGRAPPAGPPRRAASATAAGHRPLRQHPPVGVAHQADQVQWAPWRLAPRTALPSTRLPPAVAAGGGAGRPATKRAPAPRARPRRRLATPAAGWSDSAAGRAAGPPRRSAPRRAPGPTGRWPARRAARPPGRRREHQQQRPGRATPRRPRGSGTSLRAARRLGYSGRPLAPPRVVDRASTTRGVSPMD